MMHGGHAKSNITFPTHDPRRPPADPRRRFFLSAQGMGEYTNVYEFFLEQTSNFLHMWIYGLGEDGGPPLPPFKDFVTANPVNVNV